MPMLTNRKLLSILTIIAVLFLLFQGTLAIRERMNRYEVNGFREETGLDEADVPPADTYAAGHRVLFVGDPESPEGQTVAEWAGHVRYSFAAVSDAAAALSAAESAASALICVEGSALTGDDIASLQQLAEEGIHLFFTSLPEAAFIRSHIDLRQLLGIQEVRQEAVTLTGVRLYAGFLLGGERVYEAETEEEEEKQDLSLTVPWYITGSGTETYMNGLFSEKETERLDARYGDELLPALIFRNSIGTARIFSVVGDYMEDRLIGLGLLSAALSKCSSYCVYPVIDAQNITLVSFPTAADENGETIRQIYGRSMFQLESRLILPRLESLGLQEQLSFTGAFTPRLSSEDAGMYEAGAMESFLSQMNEMSSELGVSLVEDEAMTAAEKAKETRDFLQSQDVTYQISSAIVKASDLTADPAFLDDPLFSDLQTLSFSYDNAFPVAGYDGAVEKLAEKNLTIQQITRDAGEDTYSRDLELLGTETALAYTNWSMDITSVLLPQSEEDQWQKKSKILFGNISSALAPFKAFSRTTLAEGDAAVRRFAAVDYRDSRSGDTVTLSVSGRKGVAVFLFRTAGEEVAEVTGGTCEQVEEGTYLIRAEKDEVKLTLAGTDTWKAD